jgi:hypothetical protein
MEGDIKYNGMGLPACAEARQAGHISGECRKFAMTHFFSIFAIPHQREKRLSGKAGLTGRNLLKL